MQAIYKAYLKVIPILLLLLLTNCKREEEPFFGKIIYDNDSATPLVTFLYHPEDSINVSYNKHIKKTVNYSKIPYKTLEYKNFKNSNTLPKTTRVLIITNTKVLNNRAFKTVANFIANGGTVVLPTINKDYKYRFLAGVKPNVNPNVLTYADGFNFTTNYLPNFKNKTYLGYSQHFGYTIADYNKNTSVQATALNNPLFPAIIKHKLGNGHVIAFNCNKPASKENRGLYFSAILSGLEGIPYPVVNASTLYLDDFPAPTYNIKKEPILTEYNATHSDFYNKIWWPDMIALAKKENLKYTAMICFDYGNTNAPPFLFNEWKNSKSLINDKYVISGNYIINDILKNDHELALHGYNHTSLLKTDWPNVEFMQSSLKAVSKKWKVSNYGMLPVTYVPPSNNIDALGFAALKEGMPSIKYNCSLYLGEFEKGGSREYDYEPYNNAIFNFPRITSGYTFNSQSKFDQQSLFLYTGLWSHFIHPDDVYQIKDKSNTKSKGNYEYRNIENLGWKTSTNGRPGMLQRFINHLHYTKQQFPLLRFLKTETAAKKTIAWRYSNYIHTENKTTYKVASNDKSLKKLDQNYWFVYITTSTKKRFENHLKSKQLTYSSTPYLDGFLYNIITKTPAIKLIKPKYGKNKNATATINKKIANYKAISKHHNTSHTIDYYIANGNINKGIDLLKKRIKAEDINTVKDWKNLYNYLSWKGRQFEIWELLNEEYLLTQSLSLIDLSIEFVENSDYPNLTTRKLWMKRQLNTYPNNLKLQSQYNYYFNEENSALISNKKENTKKVPQKHQITYAKKYTQKGHLKHAWVLTSKLPPSKEKEHLKKVLNTKIHTLKLTDKQFLLNNYSNLFTPKTAQQLKRDIIKHQNNFITLKSGGIADKSYTITLKNSIKTGVYNKKQQLHSFSINQSELYAAQQLPKTTINRDRLLFGVSYAFQSKKHTNKPYFKSKLTLEKDNFGSFFYKKHIALTIPKKNSLSTVSIHRKPAITTSAYALNIYQTQLNLKHKHYFNTVKNSINFISNYYSDSVFDYTFLTSLWIDIPLNKHTKISPLLKASRMFGKTNNASGFPYWTLKNRSYTGGGFNFKYNNLFKNIKLTIGSCLFYDNYYGNFITLKAQLQYPLFNYFYVNSHIDMANIENYFANTFNFGLTYYLK